MPLAIPSFLPGRLGRRSSAQAPCCLVFSAPTRDGLAPFSCVCVDLRAFGARRGADSAADFRRAKDRLSLALFGHPAPRGLPAAGAWLLKVLIRPAHARRPSAWRLLDMSGASPGSGAVLLALGPEEPTLERAREQLELREAAAALLLGPGSSSAWRRGLFNFGTGPCPQAAYQGGLGGLARESFEALRARALAAELGAACAEPSSGRSRREGAL